MRKALTDQKDPDLIDEIKESYKGIVGMQTKEFFPSDRKDLTAFNKIKIKLDSGEYQYKKDTDDYKSKLKSVSINEDGTSTVTDGRKKKK